MAENLIHHLWFEESALAECSAGPGKRLTGFWCRSREKQEADGQLKELKDQLEAEQYFTVILLANIII